MTLARWETMGAQTELSKVESAINAREDDGVFFGCICSAAENIATFQSRAEAVHFGLPAGCNGEKGLFEH